MKFYKFTFLVIGLLITTQLYSQTLYFCEDVSTDGNPVSSANTFVISQKGGSLYFFVEVGYEIGMDEVYYEIYKVDSKGKEIYDQTIYKEVNPKDKKFYHQIMFHSPGRFNIYVYRGDGIYLTSNSLRITQK